MTRLMAKVPFREAFYVFTILYLIGLYFVYNSFSDNAPLKAVGIIELVINGEDKIIEIKNSRKEKNAVTNPFSNFQSSNESNEVMMACHLPQLDPFDQSIRKFVGKPAPVDCAKNSKFPPIFTTNLKSTLLMVKNPAQYGLSKCCYNSFVRRPKSEYKIVMNAKCVPIFRRTEIPQDIEYIEISCLNKTASEMRQTVDIFGFVHLKKSVEKRIEKFERNSKPETGTRKVNVVTFGIDGVSHMNFIRTFPLTYQYLRENLSALGLNGFTKVADNTFPNLVPVLTGLYSEELRANTSCWKTDKETFDNCPFIWKDYSRQGYRTALAEDAVWMGIFNYGPNKGFKNEPTDYYLKTMAYRQENITGHHGEHRNAKLCYGPRLSFKVLLEFLQQMAITMNKHRRYFQFAWAGALTHDHIRDGHIGDRILMQTLRWFKEQGYLENTVFILMSDHGIRWSRFVETLQGKLEERMPFVYFLVPQWFRDKYSVAVSNLRNNENRLSTPFDIYETLKDLLAPENIEDGKIHERKLSLRSHRPTKNKRDFENDSVWKFPRGISLFLPIPLERTCSDASIIDQWCVCREMLPVQVENNTLIEEAGRHVVHYINGLFLKYPQCKNLQLKEILNAQELGNDKGGVHQFGNITDAFDVRLSKLQVTFSLTFRVDPSNATFTASTMRQIDGTWEVMKEISRISLYGQQSRCVDARHLKPFCFCD